MGIPVFECQIDWTVMAADASLRGFRIYAMRAGTNEHYLKGTRVATAGPKDRSATFNIEQGTWRFRVIPYNSKGDEVPVGVRLASDKLRVDSDALPAPAVYAGEEDVSIGPTAPAGGSALSIPRDYGDSADKVQIIQGPNQHTGKLVAEIPVRDGSMDGDQVPASLAVDPVPMVGHGITHTTGVAMVMRPMAHGQPTDPVNPQYEVHLPEMDGAGRITVATLTATGASVNLTNFATPVSTDPYEEDNTDGFRARELPTRTVAADPEWDDKIGDLLENVPSICRFLPRLEIESSEVDMGHLTNGILDIYDEFQRKSDTIPDVDGMHMKFDHLPSERPDLVGELDDPSQAPDWIMQHLRSDGKPCRPMTNVEWWVRRGPDPGLDPVVPYERYRPLMWLTKFRYIQIKCVAVEPSGLFQMKVPKIVAAIRRPFVYQAGSDTLDANVSTKQINLTADPITGGSPFQNQFVVMLTMGAYTGTRRFVFLNAKTAATPSFTAEHVDIVAGGIPTTDTPFEYFAFGY